MTRTLPAPKVLSAAQAREFLTGHHGVRKMEYPKGKAALPALLAKLRCIQLDPLNVIGTNADLVAFARVDGIATCDLYQAVYPGQAFEHFAKERCLLPADAFPFYRDRAAETPWWRLSERLKRLPAGLVETVLDEIRERGPITGRELSPRGKVSPLDWNGWKGTSNAARMAIEVLWTRCQIVVCGRQGLDKVYDVPERALAAVAALPASAFARWALVNRVEAAGLLARAGGPVWSMLAEARVSSLPDELIAEGILEEVIVEGSPRRYLAPAGFLTRAFPRQDSRMRILGPLDPLIWDRALVRQAFGFEYIWEVYKPESQRRWGWYVCPLFHRGNLVGRLEGRVEKDQLRITKIWREKNVKLDDDSLDAALARHAKACGADKVRRPAKVLLS